MQNGTKLQKIEDQIEKKQNFKDKEAHQRKFRPRLFKFRRRNLWTIISTPMQYCSSARGSQFRRRNPSSGTRNPSSGEVFHIALKFRPEVKAPEQLNQKSNLDAVMFRRSEKPVQAPEPTTVSAHAR